MKKNSFAPVLHHFFWSKKMKFSMRGGRRKTRKKSRKFYGDWEIVNVHTRRTRKRR